MIMNEHVSSRVACVVVKIDQIDGASFVTPLRKCHNWCCKRNRSAWGGSPWSQVIDLLQGMLQFPGMVISHKFLMECTWNRHEKSPYSYGYPMFKDTELGIGTPAPQAPVLQVAVSLVDLDAWPKISSMMTMMTWWNRTGSDGIVGAEL